jgi:glycosyltransferase involved in cell wall biosynthesis
MEAETTGKLPLVSVLTPSYNHEAFIGPCIESVLSQTYPNWEQIIIDDGSTDNTRKVVEHYEDKRIRYYWQENEGIESLAKTYNRALAKARGSLIAILEGDDLWPPEKLSKMVRIFDDQEVVLAHGEVVDVDARGELSRRNPRVYRTRAKLSRSILFNDRVGSATAYLLAQTGQTFIAPATVLIQSLALKSIGGFQYVPGQCSPDIPTFVRLSVIGKFHYTPEVLGFHRRHLGQATLQNLSTMPQAALRYALDASKDPDLGLDLEEQERIEISWKKVLQKCAFSQGRIALINREWKSARGHFISAIRSLEGRIILGAGLGWALSWFHCDLEAIFRLAGRTPLKQEEA